jgi:glycosyltransferase involved in cell wall biosynthesis
MHVRRPDVLIDMTPLDTPSRFRGIGRYTACLAQGFTDLVEEGILDLRVEGFIRNGFGWRPQTDPTLRYSGDRGLRTSPWQYKCYKMARRLTMGSLAAGTGARLLHLTDPKGTPWDSRVPRIVTCHDLIPLVLHREYLGSIPGARATQFVCDFARYRSAVRLIAVSEATRRDLVTHLDVDPDRVDVVYHGVDRKRFNSQAWEGESERVQAALGVSDPFLLYLGGGDQRKRLPLLVRAYARSRRIKEARLVIAGPLSRTQLRILAKEAQASGVFQRVLFPGFVEDPFVPALYRTCLGHVFPSIYEGFGLPVLEAMSCGAPTVTTMETSLAEVAGDASLSVPADDEEALAEAIRRLVDDSALRHELSIRGPEWAARFTWRRCAAETLKCYRKALDHG